MTEIRFRVCFEGKDFMLKLGFAIKPRYLIGHSLGIACHKVEAVRVKPQVVVV